MQGHKMVFRVVVHVVYITVMHLRTDTNRSGYGQGRGRFDKSSNVSRPRVALVEQFQEILLDAIIAKNQAIY